MENKFRISKEIVPKNYSLYYDVNLKDFYFDGVVKITLDVKEKTKRIRLNCKNLEILGVNLEGNTFLSKGFEEEYETLILEFEKDLDIGESVLEIKFKGVLSDDLCGFYRSKYKSVDGVEKYLATTQFEAPYARRAFPCFDEPDFKATFDLTLEFEKDFVAISNMPVESETIIEGEKKRVSFKRTPEMSTYLLYIGIGEFDRLEDKYGEVDLAVYAIPGRAKEGEFALEVTKKCLDYFEKYSEIKYPLPKLDLIAIPDFAAGAMENWGAITFREILLLSTKEGTSRNVKKRIAEVVAHELWHQWSGNLVTMQWWDDLWLNESFATYMAYKAIAHHYPEFDMWDDFLLAETFGALVDDSLKSTHSIAAMVKSPDEIEEIFDNISYGKGGSVLHMVDSYLGEEVFRKGVSKYLKNFEYKNAVASNLWDAIEESSGDSRIKDLIENWIKTKGHPVLEVENSLIKQKRFGRFAEDDSKWMIPIVSKNKDKVETFILEEKSKDFGAEYEKLNYGQTGFYRVKYSSDMIDKLKELIRKKELSVRDRWGVSNDLFYLAVNGDIRLDIYFDFLKCFENENSFMVLEDIYSSLLKIYKRFSFGDKNYRKIFEMIKVPFEKSLERLSYEPKVGEPIEDAMLRSICLSFFSYLGDEKVISYCNELFFKFCDGFEIHPDIRSVVFGIVARNGDKRIHDLIKEKYLNSRNSEEKTILLSCLYKFEDEELFLDSLNFSFAGEVRSQDLRNVYASVAGSTYFKAKDLFFEFIKNNWEKFEQYSKSHYIVKSFLECLILPQIGDLKKEEIKEFLEEKKVGYPMITSNLFELMDMNTAFVEENKKIVEEIVKG